MYEDKLSNAVLTSSLVLLLFVRFALRVGGVDGDRVLDLLLSVFHAVVKHLEECVSALVRHQHGKYGLLHKVQSIYCHFFSVVNMEYYTRYKVFIMCLFFSFQHCKYGLLHKVQSIYYVSFFQHCKYGLLHKVQSIYYVSFFHRII